VPGENRTEKATPKRRDEARRKGQVARSIDLNAAAGLLAALVTLAVTAPTTVERLAAVMHDGLAQTAHPQLVSVEGIQQLGSWVAISAVTIAAPVVLAAMVGGLVAGIAQVRPKLNLSAAKPSFDRVNPKHGIKRLVGKQAAFETAKALSKTGVVALVAASALRGRMTELGALVGLPPTAVMSELATLVFSIAIRAAAALAVLAVVDYVWQRRRHEQSLKMTKEEVKQEMRQQDVAPEVRAAIRRRQFQQARQRMMAEVATADVVVTNPTHYAVALRYDGTKPSPEVVAKGVDLVAAAIRKEAQEHDVPVLQNPPLARTLYAEVDLGREIPEQFFAAVAEVLAFVYRMAGRRVA
jgi:flagellar biosynthesis protein FlhB